MKRVHQQRFGQFNPELPATGHIDGVPTNGSVSVDFYQKKNGFYWTTHRGNDRHKNLRGPFLSLEGAVEAAKETLRGI